MAEGNGKKVMRARIEVESRTEKAAIEKALAEPAVRDLCVMVAGLLPAANGTDLASTLRFCAERAAGRVPV